MVGDQIERKTENDYAVRNAGEAFFRTVDELAARQASAIEQSVSNARVVRLRGMHYIYLSNEAEVLREMRAFLARVKR